MASARPRCGSIRTSLEGDVSELSRVHDKNMGAEYAVGPSSWTDLLFVQFYESFNSTVLHIEFDGVWCCLDILTDSNYFVWDVDYLSLRVGLLIASGAEETAHWLERFTTVCAYTIWIFVVVYYYPGILNRIGMFPIDLSANWVLIGVLCRYDGAHLERYDRQYLVLSDAWALQSHIEGVS